MFGIHDFALFVVSGILLNLTPGPDTLYVAARGASHGFKGGAVAVLGITTGCFVHILAASLGLSAVLATSAAAFTVVKLAGAAYLLYTGLSMLLARKRGGQDAQVPGAAQAAGSAAAPAALRRVYAQGFLTNALNPKVALFFLAFLPQFIDPAAPEKGVAFFILGCVVDFTGAAWMLALAWMSARVARGVAVGGRASAWFSRIAGGLFVALGVRLALADNG
ncbi:LysE family translocator [Fundidesulfovibrio terrae]|uniref:LysE family translocator n=1 Tax=Fundidesulfovibrio terrae TaxID=2922866 RepID=UPI001FAFE04E|nr:LysE family translocator [Fundidesulfovibrio terrae]